jgi:type IV pilus assembly protein PilM
LPVIKVISSFGTLPGDHVALSIPGLFKRKAAPLLGVDITASSIKVVELVDGGKMPMRLARYAIEPVERGAINDGAVEKPEALGDSLLRALKRLNTRTRDVALALPSSAVITKRITLPAGLSEEDYELQVESEASQYIPFSIDEVNLDFQILGPAAGDENEVEVLLAASRKEKVEDRVAVAELAGLKPIVVDSEPYAARLALDHVSSFMPNHGNGQVIAVFDIGHSVTSLTIVLNNQTIFEREQAFGGNQLTQDIVRLYGLLPEEAEIKKRTGELPDNYRTDVLQPFVEQGAVDIARALQFFFTSTPYTRVDRVFVAGGSAVLPGLIDAIAERTQVPTELFSPFQGMEVAETLREHQLRQDAPALLVATGLAMRRFHG